MKPYYRSKDVVLYHGKALEVVKSLPENYIDCVVTSPPYFGLKDYGIKDQYGSENSSQDFVENLTSLFKEILRILSFEGTLWLNIGDSYGKSNKQLLGIPWMVASSLQNVGYTLRNDIIWWKRDAMPESVKDRFSSRHEHIFLFTKHKKYYFDLDSVRIEPTIPNQKHQNRNRPYRGFPGQPDVSRAGLHPLGKNPGDVWDIVTGKFKGSHFATFPVELPTRCIKSGCKPNGIVLDPFSGSGTTGVAALNEGRRYIGIDLNSEYLDLSLSHEKRFNRK